MKQTPKNTGNNLFKRAALGLFVAVLLAGAVVPPARADIFDEQIQRLLSEAEGYQAEAGRLRAQANTLQNEINAITAQQQGLTVQIAATEARLQQINNDIDNTELRIQNVKTGLAENLRSLYIEGDISPLEMVASSQSISDYLDREEARNKINEAIGKNIKKLAELKVQLANQKTEAEKVLADQKSMKAQLAAQEAQKNQLLAETQGQEANYQQLVAQRSAEVSKLREQQRLANARFIGGAAGSGPACGGGYPAVWCEIPMDTAVDSWGMYNRECVSYTAWKVASTGRRMPYWGGRGNAWQWAFDGWANGAGQRVSGPGPGVHWHTANAKTDGIPMDANPRVGDVAIANNGAYGHAMYVEAVYGDGTIGISQYNADWRGTYSTNRISAAGLVFIHF